ncbi:hypothetical protein A2803_05945 [Candidatus Woesebacteria bacterium RIFCSPHIGHO2_01_FULL_44_21]|uniref:Peptidase S9 prolyl oligopeptidase catalytic domain-containing protein n=1 Tax=Candidatus Woesebacteria bacterium RIFCSPHIGHO2_01_FULL_44_21 TaxID=1802503 RepID=A0A1F7Z1K9_9BACT|nr:MAG: hypothetical protein A2803_05945 [Candidatus Woesebacteria bacterium RIFCSPHIGHO2_01_FULL_44_21]OGM71077.1 MAG: hypothetical protein A2897_02480 [Candidatus Woesebacteria bacterium RIFCSPLOWO2_01_FULL_44_24b]
MSRYVIILTILVSAVVSGIVGYGFASLPREGITIFEPEPTPIPTPLAIYEIDNLAETQIPKGEIEIKDIISEEDRYISYLFEHKFSPNLNTDKIKTVTGQINIPNEPGSYPLVFMIRGYVDQNIFETGMGTKNAAAYFAENGFITVAPDFLGYGGSSPEAGNIYETRFQTYTTALSILSSLSTIKQWNNKDLFIWAHSNGGQIALTVLAITGREIPTTLWAPVTKPFPYSVLYYTDESHDGGKYIRRELAKFEELYDVDKYTFSNYLKRIKALLLVHQGGADDAIPTEWSDSFVAKMRSLDNEVEYYKYPNADHNMRPDWDTVVARDVDFFKENVQN